MKWLCAFKQKEPQNLPEAVKRQYRCAFTGHRPEKVVGSEVLEFIALQKSGFFIKIMEFVNSYNRVQ